MAVKQLVEDFARYLYLPRVAGPEVLVQAMHDGVALLTWQADTCAYAESHDEGGSRCLGLRGGQIVSLSPDSTGDVTRGFFWNWRAAAGCGRTSPVPVWQVRPRAPTDGAAQPTGGPACGDEAVVARCTPRR